MRHALMMGMDRSSLIKALFGDIAPGLKPLDSLLFYPNDVADYRTDFHQWNYDPAKALALLKQHCTGGPSAPTRREHELLHVRRVSGEVRLHDDRRQPPA